MVVRVLYCVFLGVLVVLFVGWSMAAWFPMPTWETEYPKLDRYQSPPQTPSDFELKAMTRAQQQAAAQKYQRDTKTYEDQEEEVRQANLRLDRLTQLHNRNVALASLVIAVIIVALSVGLAPRIPVISEGLLLGGLFTLVYSIGWSFFASPKIAVIPVGVGLIVTVALGYQRFVKPSRPPAPPASP